MRFYVCFLLALACLQLVSCKKRESTTPMLQNEQLSAVPARSALQKSFFLKHHFGEVNANERLTCSLELKNETDKPMSFGFSNTSCGSCLFVKSMPERILSGESGIFELEFDATGRRGATSKQAVFWDAEPKTLLVLADVTATVRAVWTDPEMINLGNLSNNESKKEKLYVLAAGYPDAKVTSVQCDAPWLTLTSKPVETSRELRSQSIRAIDYCEIEWTGKGTVPGNLSSKIVFHVQKDDESQEEQLLEVSVSGYLSGDVEIIPSNIVFGRVAQNEVVRACTLTFKKQGIDVAKIKCTADHAYIQTSFKESQEVSDQFILTTSITPPVEEENQLIEGTITGTDESGEIIFSIPYIAFFDMSTLSPHE